MRFRLAVRGLLIIIFNFLFYTRMVIFFWDLFFLEHGPNHLQIITKLGVAWWLLSAKLDRAAEQEAETSQTDQRSWRGDGIYTEREQSGRQRRTRLLRGRWALFVGEKKNKKKTSHYTTISHFTQTLYLDYRHYVPIKHKRKVWHFKLFRESAYCLSGKKKQKKKQREKLKYIIIF